MQVQPSPGAKRRSEPQMVPVARGQHAFPSRMMASMCLNGTEADQDSISFRDQ